MYPWHQPSTIKVFLEGFKALVANAMNEEKCLEANPQFLKAENRVATMRG